jgi:transposase
MAYNFVRGDRDQPFLLPPDLRDWLPEGHLAWFILDVVDQLDLQPFYRAHRGDGHGHPAYDPKLLLGVLLYGYCLGVRSSRQLERRCTEDIAFRVLAANQVPDHVTIARFRVRHQQALAGFLVESLKLCAAAGMVRVGMVALDGTKLAGNAADKANRTLDRLEREVAEILRQAADADQREDAQYGEARGDELPPALASKTSRLARLRQAKARLEAEAAERARRFAERAAASAAAAAAKGKPPRQLKPRTRDEAPNPTATANVTDPDSRLLHTRKGRVQGYNAQAATTLEQVIVAAELTQDANDFQQLQPMLDAISATLDVAGIQDRPGTLAADSGYWSIANLTQLPGAPQLLIPPPRHGNHGKPRKDGKPSGSKSDGLRAAMTAKLQSEDGRRATPSARRPSSRCSARSRSSRAPGGSCGGDWPPARRSGSCCAVPTTCSSCGGTPPPASSQAGHRVSDHQPSPRDDDHCHRPAAEPSPEVPGAWRPPATRLRRL